MVEKTRYATVRLPRLIQMCSVKFKSKDWGVYISPSNILLVYIKNWDLSHTALPSTEINWGRWNLNTPYLSSSIASMQCWVVTQHCRNAMLELRISYFLWKIWNDNWVPSTMSQTTLDRDCCVPFSSSGESRLWLFFIWKSLRYDFFL